MSPVSGRYLLDTDILIEYLRGREPAVAFLEGLEGEWLLSAITVAELFSGARGAAEEQTLDHFLLAFEVIPVDEELARAGGRYRRDHGPRHGTGLADAVIAATADRAGAVLVTFNRRHFPMLKRVRVPYPRK